MVQDQQTDQQGRSLSYFGHPSLIERPDWVSEIRSSAVKGLNLTGNW
ncbi:MULTISPECIES: hypothetical protein [Asaia]